MSIIRFNSPFHCFRISNLTRCCEVLPVNDKIIRCVLLLGAIALVTANTNEKCNTALPRVRMFYLLYNAGSLRNFEVLRI